MLQRSRVAGHARVRVFFVHLYKKYSVLLLRFSAMLLIAVFPAASILAETQGGMPETRIRGVADTTLRGKLTELTPLLWPGSQPPTSEAMLRGRARRHQQRLLDALASEGHYNATASFDVVWTTPRPQVSFDIEPGPRYRFDVIEVAYQHTPDGPLLSPPPVHVSPELHPGAAASAKSILDGEKRLVREATNTGFPFATVHHRRVQINHDTESATVTYFLALGEELAFGPPRLQGLDKVRPETVLREIPWQEGDTYRASLLVEAEEALRETGLFTVARVTPAPVDDAEDGAIPIVIDITERRHRSIALGLQYRTDEGVGVGGQWEHRNFLGLGRRLRLQSTLTELEQSLGADYNIQKFRRPDQTLTLHAKAAQLDPDPYRSRRFDVGAWVEREVSREWTVGMGPALRISQVDERRKRQEYYLASFPMQITYDRRNDRMDPTSGYRVANRMSPFVDITDLNMYFLKNELNISHFFQFSGAPSWTLATRLRLGIIGGANRSDIPADERFYAGGGGSIRGYDYQKVGPLDDDGEPTGGRSLTDWSVEIRKRISETIGVVAFVDGGMAHQSVYPDFSTSPQWGAGVGARYFTPIGPLRLDVATPINRRKELDSRLHFYISIGQAF